jgi:FkbM family methyltransferase
MKQFESWIKTLILWVLKALGHDFDPVSLTGALGRVRRWKLEPRTVIDIGASDGRWTRVCQRYFPEAQYFLIDAQSAHMPALQRLRHDQPQVQYLIAAAGDSEGMIHFDASELLGGIASHVPVDGPGWIEVSMTTVDQQVREHGLQPPFLLKLDTHGFEVPIFQGARETLKDTTLIVVETYNFVFTGSNLRFHEMCTYLEAQGFRCADMCDPLHRTFDEALWQFDLFFVRADHPIFQHNLYR